MLKLRYRDSTENLGEKWRPCVLCGPTSKRGLLYFDSGSTEPTAGETVTGATSADTGVLETCDVTSGTWAGGDAAGVMVLTTLTGDTAFNRSTGAKAAVFSDDENLNGSTSGNNFATANGNGSVCVSGILYPECDLVMYEGKEYCKAHFEFRYRNKLCDREKSTIDEGDRV